MPDKSMKVNKPAEPVRWGIWISLIVGCAWLCLMFYALGVILFEHAWEHQGVPFLITSCLNLFAAYTLVSNAVWRRRYWRRIASQRDAALSDPDLFRSSDQPLVTETGLQLPVTVRLSLRPQMIVSIFVALAALLAIFALFSIKSFEVGKIFDWTVLLIGIGLFLGSCLVLFSFLYFVVFCAQTQSIELSEEGITTRYHQHTRRIRWEEARVFACYQQDVRVKTVNGLAFELSNERTIVRWSQQYVAFPYLNVEHNQQQKDDFNWLVARVNAYITTRTELPLLAFKDTAVLPTVSSVSQHDHSVSSQISS